MFAGHWVVEKVPALLSYQQQSWSKIMGLGLLGVAVKPAGAPMELPWKLAVEATQLLGGKLYWVFCISVQHCRSRKNRTRNRKWSPLLQYPSSAIMPAGKGETFLYQKKIIKGRVGTEEATDWKLANDLFIKLNFSPQRKKLPVVFKELYLKYRAPGWKYSPFFRLWFTLAFNYHLDAWNNV